MLKSDLYYSVTILKGVLQYDLEAYIKQVTYIFLFARVIRGSGQGSAAGSCEHNNIPVSQKMGNFTSCALDS
jgi:hypothetical protein